LINKSEVLLFGRALVSVFGVRMFTFMTSFYILSITGSGLALSASLAITVIPVIFISPIAGVVIDKIEVKYKKNILAVCNLGRASVFLCLHFVQISFFVLCVSLFVLSCLNVFFDNSVKTIITFLRDSSDSKRLRTMNSVNHFLSSASTLIAPVLGGVLIAIYDLQLVALICSVFFLFIGISELSVRLEVFQTKTNDIKAKHISIVTRLKEFIDKSKDAVVVIKNNKVINLIVVMELVSNFLVTLGFLVASTYIIVNHVLMNSAQLGILLSVKAAGSLAGSTALFFTKSTVKSNYPLHKVMCLGYCMILFGVISFLSNFIGNSFIVFFLLSLTLFGYGMLATNINITIVTIMQNEINKNEIGKILGFVSAISAIHVPITLMLSGYLLENLAPHLLPLICGGILTFYVFLRSKLKFKVN